MNPNMKRARENEDQALQAIGLVGWLTTAQVAAWVWPDSGEHSARNRATEVLGRLLEHGFVLRRHTGLGAWAYLLTHSGAARANVALDMILCRPGYDLSQLDGYKQEAIVAYLLTQKSVYRMGPAGVRGAVRCGFVEVETLRQADALTWDPDAGEWAAAIVVRSLHTELLAKARRLRKVAARVELLGPPGIVRQFAAALAPADGDRK
jgi:hypothetical protein